MCYYVDQRRRVGDVFTIREPYVHPVTGKHIDEFSKTGMVDVDPRTPEHTTTPSEHIRQEHDRIFKGRLTGRTDTSATSEAAEDEDEEL